MARKIILNLAISLDGYISDEDGGFDWLKGDGDKTHDTKETFDFPSFISTVDILFMGRETWEICTPETLEMFKGKKIYVATHKELENKPDNVAVISGDIVQKISELRKEDGKDIWLFGGAVVADQFIKADLIDEYIIAVHPLILGNGRPLFLKDNPTIKLHFEEFTSQEGVVILKYSQRKTNSSDSPL